MDRVLVGLLVLAFMLGTMLVAARLAVRKPGSERREPGPPELDRPSQAEPEPVEFVALVDTALRSALD